MRYVIISFDDNTEYDRKAIELLNKYHLKGTFFINSGTVGNNGYISRDELRTLYKGHEIASHTINHLNLTELTKEEITYQIKEDIDFLESYSDQKVIGFAYPFGDYNSRIVQVLKELGVKYARTTDGTKKTTAPDDFLLWHPTMHFSGLAWDTNDRERRNRGVEFMFKKFEDFLGDPNGEVFHIWMHSWEMKDDRYKWDQLERLFRIINIEDVEVLTYKEYFKRKH
jgi:peptidoglycan/xylan/chitin deacetylase (PgdA/CDA1 family)